MDAARELPDDDALIAEEHDDPECTCDSCERERLRDESRAVAREASVRGGLFPQARALLGEWLLEPWEQQGDAMDVGQLAQHALGDVFDAVERIGTTGRDACRPKWQTNPAPVSRAEMLALIDHAEDLIKFARVQMEYLPHSAFRMGQSVEILIGVDHAGPHGDETVRGTYAGATRGGQARVRTLRPENDQNGVDNLVEVLEVPHDQLRIITGAP